MPLLLEDFFGTLENLHNANPENFSLPSNFDDFLSIKLPTEDGRSDICEVIDGGECCVCAFLEDRRSDFDFFEISCVEAFCRTFGRSQRRGYFYQLQI